MGKRGNGGREVMGRDGIGARGNGTALALNGLIHLTISKVYGIN